MKTRPLLLGTYVHCVTNSLQGQINQRSVSLMLPDLCYPFKLFSVIAHGNSQHTSPPPISRFQIALTVTACADDVITTLMHIPRSGIASSGDIHQS